MNAEDAVSLTTTLREHGLDWCICGGWGVDALLGRQSREHKDLDVFVERAVLPVVLERLGTLGYRRAYAWEENRPMDGAGPCAGMDSAFVLEGEAGRIIDIHVYSLDGSAVTPLWALDRRWAWREFAGTGAINGVEVTCLTSELQLELHEGYELPPSHLDDVAGLLALDQKPDTRRYLSLEEQASNRRRHDTC